MRTTLAVLAALGVASTASACSYENDRKTDEDTVPAATAAPSVASAVAVASAATKAPAKPSPAEAIGKTLGVLGAAWNSHDASRVAALFEPTAKLSVPGLPDVVGHDALVADAKQTFDAYSDFKVAVTRIFRHGNTVVFEWVTSGKNDGPGMGGRPATGRSTGIAGASVATFDDDGLIKEEHRYYDIPTLQSQLDPKAKAGTFRAPPTLPTSAPEQHVSKGTPDEAKTIDQGNAILKADQSKDEATFLATVTDDYVWEDYSAPAPIKKADLKGVMASYAKAFPDFSITPSITFAADGFYVVEATFAGTQKGALGANKASNKPVSSRMVDIQLLKDGKASREWSYSNNADLLVQIGALPPLSTAPAGSGSAAGSTKAAPPASAPAPSAKPR